MAILVGDKIILREYRIEDLPMMRAWVNNPEITKNLSNVFLFPHTLNNTEKFLNSMLEGSSDYKGYVIADKITEDYIGQIDLIEIDWLNKIATLGIVIGSVDNIGRGFGTDAIKLLQEFAFNRLNLHKIELEVRDTNIRAIYCYKKCGFIEEGRIRENFFVEGNYTDTVLMGILKREYDKRIDF